jgi:hypothetical protein
MEKNNVSYQLFNKQLPEKAYNYTFDQGYLNVDPVESDKSVEQAFQEQLSLAEYYKSPIYLKGTQEHKNMEKVNDELIAKEPAPAPEEFEPIVKESFGKSNSRFIIKFFIIVTLLFIVLNLINI